MTTLEFEIKLRSKYIYKYILNIDILCFKNEFQNLKGVLNKVVLRGSFKPLLYVNVNIFAHLTYFDGYLRIHYRIQFIKHDCEWLMFSYRCCLHKTTCPMLSIGYFLYFQYIASTDCECFWRSDVCFLHNTLRHMTKTVQNVCIQYK